MDLQINGKTALVTGAGRGIGRSVALNLAQEGVNVIACSRGSAGLEELETKISKGNHEFIPVDLTKVAECDRLIDIISKSCGSPDIIVNNVGGNLGLTDPLGPVSEWQNVMRLNVEIALQINHAFVPKMQSKQWGRICHISSISALENQGPPSYCAAKLALNAYVRSVGRYVSSDNVIMTSVLPGAVLSEGGYWDIASKERPDHVAKYLEDRMAIKRFGTVEEISKAVVFLCSEHASFCVGSSLLIDGGQGRVFHQGSEE